MRALRKQNYPEGEVVSKEFDLGLEPVPVFGTPEKPVPMWAKKGCTLAALIDLAEPHEDQKFDIRVEGYNGQTWSTLVAGTDMPGKGPDLRDGKPYAPRARWRSTVLDAHKYRVVVNAHQPARFGVTVEVE